ncbi:MAG: hypothetical protein Q9195_001849 [Heterodermia aff. obscurata]
MPQLSDIQIAIALEAGANVLSATAMLLFPHYIFNLLTSTSSSTESILNPTSAPPAGIQLLQWLAAITYGLTPPLLVAFPAHRDARDRRWTAYITLGAVDTAQISTMLWQALMWESDDGGVTRRALLGSTCVLIPFLAWRVWVLGLRPEMLGKSGRDGKMEKLQLQCSDEVCKGSKAINVLSQLGDVIKGDRVALAGELISPN